MSRILVLGCGELAWGRPSQSALFGRQWTRGRLSEKIGLGAAGPLPGAVEGLDWVTLADEVERQRAFRPAAPLGPEINVRIDKAKPAQALLLLPSWPELARSQARWATRELGGAGVLVTPKEWLASLAGRQLLAAWASEGWTWATLEQVLHKRYSANTRSFSASGLWLRVCEREGGFAFANGPEAARALEMAPAIVDRVVEERLGAKLAGRWRKEEEAASGWYVQQQIARRIAQALKDGIRKTIDLTEGGGALFRFSTPEAQELYQPLAALRLQVTLPAEIPAWWEQVSQPGFLQSPAGVPHPGIRWEDKKTVLFEGAEGRPLASYMSFRGLAREEVDPARLEEALELGATLPAVAAPAEPVPPASREPVAPPAAEREAPPPVEVAASPELREATVAQPAAVESVPQPEAPPPAPPADLPLPPAVGGSADGGNTATSEPVVTAFHAFEPQTFSLAEVDHRPDRVRVWLDGDRVEAGNIRRSTRRGIYTIEGIHVPHGAIVRIDFEPPQD